jgi:prepilin-type N-terminal cleavage/methylation domain-containing protein
MMIPQRQASTTSEAGFTLVEMLVALAVTALLLIGVLFTFDLNSRVARAQSNLSDLQQSLRVAQDDMVRLVRMAGRGSLPLTLPGSMPLPQGLALGVRDNVPNNQFMSGTDEATRILPGTDVLTVRGVFGPLYQVNVAGSATFDNPNAPTSGTLTILDITPGGASQDLGPIKTAITTRTPEAIFLAAAVSDAIQAVVELDPAASSMADHQVIIAFRVTGGTRTDKYSQLSTGGTFQRAVENVAFAGILEEHRYYVREEHIIAGDRTSDLAPKLARGRFYPGTNDPYKGDAGNAHLDLADNIVDLQVALAFDTANGGSGYPLLETANGTNDDWLFNGSADDATAVLWQGPPVPAIQYVRVTTLARTDRRDSKYQAPLLPSNLENRAYASGDPLNSYASRMYRWQTLRTVIDLRNM